MCSGISDSRMRSRRLEAEVASRIDSSLSIIFFRLEESIPISVLSSLHETDGSSVLILSFDMVLLRILDAIGIYRCVCDI